MSDLHELAKAAAVARPGGAGPSGPPGRAFLAGFTGALGVICALILLGAIAAIVVEVVRHPQPQTPPQALPSNNPSGMYVVTAVVGEDAWGNSQIVAVNGGDAGAQDVVVTLSFRDGYEATFRIGMMRAGERRTVKINSEPVDRRMHAGHMPEVRVSARLMP